MWNIWARCMKGPPVYSTSSVLANRVFYPIHRATQGRVRWDAVIAPYLIGLISRLLKEDLFADDTLGYTVNHWTGLVQCHYDHVLDPSPFLLVRDIQDWVSRMPDSNLDQKAKRAREVLEHLVVEGNLFGELSDASDLEKQDLESFAQFFLELFARVETPKIPAWQLHYRLDPERPLAILRSYLGEESPK